MWKRRGSAILLGALVVSMGCAPANTRSARASIARSHAPKTRATPAEHVVVILMENHEYPQIIGSSDAHYINRFAKRNVLLTREYAITHPSLPNYLALTGGSTFGITSDCTDCSVKGKNIVDQLEAHDISWKAYMESMPRPCFEGASAGRAPDEYAKKHDPFIYYDDVRNRPRRCKKIVPFSQLPKDLNGGLPQFAWISPNECHDMHSCSVATGDAWLRRWARKILPALGKNGILMVLFDEGSSDAACCSVPGGGHVAAIIAGPGARHGRKIRTKVDHYSLLRLIEDEWGLKRLRHAGDSVTPSITGWHAG